ncbi:hypothetical protein [Streptomyces sp. NPDC046685]|uniref:WDGH domain-containing protein n=1 Tax=Streptomyces sp. NPDC046685 TaxID=3157202 RepID=UPI0033D6EB9C
MAEALLAVTVDVAPALDLTRRIAVAVTDAIAAARADDADDQALAAVVSSAVLSETLRVVPTSASQAETERDRAYRERAYLVAHLAALYPSHIGYTDPDTPDWAVVTIEAPGGQMTWHVAPNDMDLFGHVTPTNRICRGWDGHTTDEKYERLRSLTATTRPLPVGP